MIGMTKHQEPTRQERFLMVEYSAEKCYQRFSLWDTTDFWFSIQTFNNGDISKWVEEVANKWAILMLDSGLIQRGLLLKFDLEHEFLSAKKLVLADALRELAQKAQQAVEK